ncbi:hypothetical protein JW887_04605 [Candidatus Dojkabacteria bacterium]|nr:hypothetical protein [Candidatus Dojkabacteria bacterium]
MGLPLDLFSKVKKKILDSKNVLLCINTSASFDTQISGLALIIYLKDHKKKLSVFFNGELSSKMEGFYSAYEFDRITELKPLNYVITIDHKAGNIEKVSYDDKDGKFSLFITPSESDSEFDFTNVAYDKSGGQYDLIITLGVRSLSWLGNIYEKNKSIFDNEKIININNLSGNQDYGNYKLVDTDKSVAETVYRLLQQNSTESSSTIVQLLLMGLMDKFQLLRMTDYKISTVETMMSFVRAGGDIKRAVDEVYFNKDFKGFSLVQRVFNNLKIDKKSKICWSGVTTFDIKQCGIGKKDILLDGRVVFNISNNFNLAFVLYEVEEDEVWGEVDSNNENIDVKKLFNVMNAVGDEKRVKFIIKGKSLAQVETEILEFIKSKLHLEEINPEVNITSNAVSANIPESSSGSQNAQNNGSIETGQANADSINESSSYNADKPEGLTNGDNISKNRTTPINRNSDSLVIPPPVNSI